MKPKFNRFLITSLGATAALSSFSWAVQIYKDLTTTDINTVANWSTTSLASTPDPGSIGTTDTLRFNEYFAPTSGTNYTAQISGDLTTGGIKLDYGSAGGGTAFGNVIISGANTLNLNGTVVGESQYAGAVFVLNSATGGSLTVNPNIVIGAVSTQIVSSRTLNLNGNLNWSTFGMANNIAGGTTSVSGVVSGSGNWSKSGAGTYHFNNVANDFTGSVTAAGGTLRIEKLANSGSTSSIGSGSSAIALNGTTLSTSATGVGGSTNRTIEMRAGAGLSSNGTGPISFTAANVSQTLAASARTLTLGGSNANANTFGSILGDSGTAANITSLTKSGTGTWIASGANTYTGATTISAGTLKAGVASVAGVSGAFGKNSAVSLANVASANLDLNGFDTQIGSLTGGGTTGGNVVLGANTLTIGALNTSPAAYAGGISGIGGGITKIGSGTLTLSGTTTYTGATAVNAGTLSVTGSQTGSAVQVANAATLGGTGTVGATTVASGGLLAPGVAGAGKLTTGNLAFTGTSTITVGAFTNYTAAPAIAAGTLTASGAAGSVTINLGGSAANNGTYQLLSYTGGSIAGTGASAFVLGTKPAVGGRQSQSLVDTGSALNWVVSGANPIWTGVTSSEWSTNTIGGSKNWKLQGDNSPTDYLAGDLVIFDDSAIGTTVDISVANVAPSSMLFSNDTQSYTIQGSGSITAGALSKTGAGGLTLNTANSFNGGATLGGGTITLGTATALGSGSVALNGGTLAMNGQSIANAVVLAGGAITGSGAISGDVTGSALSYSSSGSTLILSAANTIGATIGAGATLQIGDGGTSGTIGNVTDNGTLVFNRSDALTHSGTISGTGSVQKSGAGTLTFNNAKTYSGSTSVSDSGKLLVSSTLLNSSGFNVGTGATLELGATNLFVSGHGTAMAASRVIAVNGGTLLMNNSFAARFGNVSLSNGATWTSNQGLSGYDALLSDTTAGAATVTVSGTGVSTMNGSGGIHLAGVQNFDVAEVTASSDPDLIVSMILGAQGTTGGAAGGINKLGAGTMALSGTNTYSGGTTVTAGTLQVGNGGTTGTMGSGAVTNNAALVLNYGIGASVGLGNVISGTGSLTKQGLGLVALNGASDYNGTTTVSEGTLRIGNSLVNSPVTVQSGGIIGAGSQSTVGTGAVKSLTLASGSASTFRVGFPSDQLVINDVDGLTIGGSHVVTAVFTGGLNPGDTVPIIDYTGSLGGGGFANLSLAPGSRFTLSNNPVDTSIDLTYTGGTLTWEGKLSTAWDLNTTANWNLGGSPTYFLTGDAALFDDSATSGSVVLSGTQTPSSLTINNETLAYTLSGGTLGGTGLVNKLGTGVATITSDTTYGGATWIDAGTLTFGDGATSGQIGTGVVEILPGGTLRINRSDLLDYKASPRLRTLTGAGDIVVEGGGTLFNYPGTGTSFADATSWAGFSGNLTIRGGSEFQTIRNGATAMGTGTVILGDATTSGSLSQIEGSWTWTNHISLVGSANKILNRSNATQSRMLKLQGVISGSGGLSFEDPGISMINNNRGFILTGTNTMDGTLTIPAGVPVRVGGVPGDTDVNQSGAGISGSLGTATVVADGTLTFSRTDAHSVTNAISGSGALRVGIPLVDGYGDTTTQVLTYTGTASHTGLTTVNNGTLIVGSGGSMGGSSVTVAATGTLGGEGTLAAPLTAAGTIAPGVGVGTLTVADTVLTGTYLCELDGTGADKLSANALDITGATLAFSVTNAPSAASYTIATYTGALGGSFASTTVPAGYALDYTTAGQINLVAVAVPGYTAWATTHAAGGTFNADFDNDGMPNGMEYFMGATGSSFTSNPKPVNGVVSFPRDATASGVVYKVLTSPNLTTWTDKTADADNSDPAFVKYTLPTGQGKIFVRLEVIQN